MTASAIAGLPPHEQPDWLPSPDDESLPDWLRALSQVHRAAVGEHERAVLSVVAAEAEAKDAGRRWRRSVNEAVAVGEPKPERDFDPDVQRAEIEIAQEDSVAAREQLARVVVATLAELRGPRREELKPHLGQLSPALYESIVRGPYGIVNYATDLLRKQLAELTSEPAIVDLSDPAHRQFAGDEMEAVNAA